MSPVPVRIGVLALQGSFSEHIASLQRLGIYAVEVRLAAHLAGVDALIMPGGESTTVLKLLDLYELRAPVLERIRGGMPVLGTCAGTVCLAREITTHDMSPLGAVDMRVARNAFGRQVESFEEDLVIQGIEGGPFRGVFIRAPIIESCWGEARVVATLEDGTIAACRQGNIMVTAFHPEFVDDLRVHRLFVDMVRGSKETSSSSVDEMPHGLRAR